MDSTVSLERAFSWMPKVALVRRIGIESDAIALSDMVNLALRVRSLGHRVVMGHLNYEDLDEMIGIMQRRIDHLASKKTTMLNKRRREVQQRPYLDPQLQRFDPNGKEKTNIQAGYGARPAGRRPKRRRARRES